MNFFTELINRITLESPKFFKKWQTIGAYFVGSGFTLAGVPKAFKMMMPESTIDLSLVYTIASYIVLTGFIICAMAKMPVENPDYSTLDKKK